MKYFYLFFPVLLVMGCTKETLELTNPGLFDESDGELSARIDGRRFEANAAFATHDNSDDIDSLSILQIIGGDIKNEETGEAIVLYLFLPQEELPASGSYTLNDDCTLFETTCLLGAYGQSLGNGNIQQTFIADSDDPRAAIGLSFTTYEVDGQLAIRGTFSMSLVSDEDDVTEMRITDGKFDILIAELE